MPIFVFGTIPNLEDGSEVLWHSIRLEELFAVYCFGGIETFGFRLRQLFDIWNLSSTASAVLRHCRSDEGTYRKFI